MYFSEDIDFVSVFRFLFGMFSWIVLKLLFHHFFMESLILAQDERWRRA